MKRIFFLLPVFCISLNTGSHDIRMTDPIRSQKSGTSLWWAGQEITRYVYVGAEACAVKCHNNNELGHQYDRWKESRHSQSYTSLSTDLAQRYCKEAGITEDPRESLTCLKCHVTASGADSSSIGTTYKREDGVTCESCHKGEFIPKTFLPGKDDCLKCHNDSVHNVSPFDFSERCMKISHPRPKN